MNEEFYSTTEVAQRLKVHANTVRKWIRRGLLEANRVGPKDYRVSSEAIERFVKGQPAKPRQSAGE